MRIVNTDIHNYHSSVGDTVTQVIIKNIRIYKPHVLKRRHPGNYYIFLYAIIRKRNYNVFKIHNK